MIRARISAMVIVCTVVTAVTVAADQTATGTHRRSPAMEKILAAERGDTPEVRALVAGTDPNARDAPHQRTALMWSVLLHDAAAVQRFIQAAADVNAVDDRGVTALFYAAASAMENDASKIVEALIAKGADVNGGVRGAGTTPLMLAANANAVGVVRAILPKLDAKSMDASTMDGITVLMAAAAVGARDIVYLLLEKGASIDLRDLQSKTALIHAAGRRFPGTTETVKLLLEMGADPTAKDKAGNSALSEAQQHGSPEVVELIKKAGAQDH